MAGGGAPNHESEVVLGRVVEAIRSRRAEPRFGPGDLLRVPRSVFRRHAAVFGQTGTGKTGLLCSLVEDDIRNDRPIIVLDGVGGTYEHMECVLALRLLELEIEERRAPVGLRRWFRRRKEKLARRYALLDVTRDDPLWRWNLLEVPPSFQPWEVVADIIDAFKRLLEAGDVETMRRLLQVIRAILSALVQVPGTVLRDALDALVFPDWPMFVDYLRSRRDRLGGPQRDDAALAFLASFFSGLKGKELQLRSESTWNALGVFLGDPVVARLTSSPTSTLDFEAIMRGEQSLLIRLPPGRDVLTQRVLGGALLNRIMHVASKRSVHDVATGRVPRITLYIDEVAAFAGKSFTQDLTRIRNYGISVIAAAQNFRQEPWHTVEGQALYEAMRGNMANIFLFRVSMGMARAEVENIFRPDGDRLARTQLEVTETRGTSTSEGSSVSATSSSSTSRGTSEGGSYSDSFSDGTTSDPIGLRLSSNTGSSRGNSHHTGSSRSASSSEGWSEGQSYQRSESYSRSEKERRDYFTLEEETRLDAHKIASAPARHMYVALGDDDQEVYFVKTLDVVVDWETRWGGKDWREEFFNLAAPPTPIPEPVEALEVRLRALFNEERRQQVPLRVLPTPRGTR